ncbi:biopolymer transport protein ExbB [Haloferula luteola]|uniref:Biopolymer transport protein ExbB n=1 Tax=Haloferula luteola TaxID=595692 RepID=A0A840UZ58_9BACT|nr:MotA/TolQ/ExbB proton channel family protein [Haloferula luteola]MBB5350283.1 biopolymer transport protein ExbB [Haloferula luteola]
MKRRISLAFLLLAGAAFAQTASEKQLNDAREELKTTRSEYTAMRTDLFRQINKLDDEALALGTELRGLEREAELRNNQRESLKREIEGREAGFNYTTGILNQYGDAFLTRLHPAENQLYKERIDDAAAKATAAGDDLLTELDERLVAARVGIERLGAVLGGHRFDGEGLRNGSEAIQGKFLILGPSVYMREKGGDFEGVATFTAGGTALPTVVALQGVEQGGITTVVDSGTGSLPFDPTMGKAIEVQAAEESLGDTIEAGGYVGHAILLLGAIALGLTVFKVIEITRFPVPSRRLVNEVLDDLLADRQSAAAKKAATISGLSGELVRTGVERFYEKRRVLEEALFEKLVAIKPKLERFLPFLGLTAAAAPLMGLLGTVLGIIKTFKAMALYGSGNQKAFTQGISEALITTAEGLVVAIPVLVLHGLMKSLARGKFSEVEGVAISLMNGTTELERVQESKGGSAKEDGGDDEDSELVPNPI